MGHLKLRGKDLKRINFGNNVAIGTAIDIMLKHYKHTPKNEQIQILYELKENPEKERNSEIFGALVEEISPMHIVKQKREIALEKAPKPAKVYGRKLISSNAYLQMQTALSLPIATRGALMPDAHHGYGLPIGGVLATKNAIIPYGVGMDIGCRMSLTIYNERPAFIDRYNYQLKLALKDLTCFGNGGSLDIPQEHEILDRTTFNETALLKKLHGKAVKQLGTSGSGNHFVEFGVVTVDNSDDLGIPPGEYLGLLAHSGSRGLGAGIAQHYTQLAMQECLLPQKAKNMAWLDLDSQAGQEYWLSMNLAGDFAKACHDRIHINLAKHLGIKPIAKVENHHNFAWKEMHQGEELVVHRKGATPAAVDELGIIPGSMTATGYIVRGRGNPDSLNSASHGAGRKLSRTKAKASVTGSELRKVLKSKGVTLIGGGVDEAPMAYKDLEKVMACQTELVDVVGSFTPKIVRMDKNAKS